MISYIALILALSASSLRGAGSTQAAVPGGGGGATTPTWIATGTVSDGAGAGATPAYGSNNSGDLFILRLFTRTESAAPAAIAGWTQFADYKISDFARLRLYFRNTRSTGGESGTVTVSTVAANVVLAAIDTYRDVATSNFLEAYFPHGQASVDTSIEAPTVAAFGANRLACAFGGATDDLVIDSFTGESGGDWTLRQSTSSTTGSDACFWLQTAALDSGGTISGGSFTVATAEEWSQVGFALVGTGATAWSQTSPGNVLAWYYASTTYIFEDDPGTDTAENGEDVAVWKNRNDVSANNIAEASNRPNLETTGWNGVSPSVLFNGAGDVLSLSSGTMLTEMDGDDTPFTLFATLQCTIGNQDQSLFCWDNSGGNEAINVRTDNSGDNLLMFQRRDTANSISNSTGTIPLSTGRVRIAVYFSGSTITTWVNGVRDLNAAATNVGVLTTLNRFRFGNGIAGSFTGRISELVVCTGDKSAHVGHYQMNSAMERTL